MPVFVPVRSFNLQQFCSSPYLTPPLSLSFSLSGATDVEKRGFGQPGDNCGDGMRNDGEVGIDCGGPCRAVCSETEPITFCDVHSADSGEDAVSWTEGVVETAASILAPSQRFPLLQGELMQAQYASFLGTALGCCESPSAACSYPAYSGSLDMASIHSDTEIDAEAWSLFTGALEEAFVSRGGVPHTQLGEVTALLDVLEPEVCTVAGCPSRPIDGDCFGVVGGSAVVDSCGLCGGDDTSCLACDTATKWGLARCFFPFLFTDDGGRKYTQGERDRGSCKHCGQHRVMAD
jgi:hypothetical protein